MAQPAVNEGEYLKDAVRQTAARQVMRALLTAAEGRVQGVESQEAFLNVVELFAAEAIATAETPLLLVPSRAQPTWLIELARNHGSGQRLRRLPGHDESRSYVGHLGDVEVQIAPCNPGESLLCWRSVFESFTVSDVAASASDEKEPQRCTLVLSWYQRALFRGESRVLRLSSLQKPDS